MFDALADGVRTELRDASGEKDVDELTLVDIEFVRDITLLEETALERETLETADCDGLVDVVADAEPEIMDERVPAGLAECDADSEAVLFDVIVIVVVTVADFVGVGVTE